ncbi:transposase [Bdellovibrio sp. HCB185ZH]|uniref:transposase n=1 Tax=Bdellovibrio sp. HCB185ZH TaxID=3394235 RepID=UPI0039A6D810
MRGTTYLLALVLSLFAGSKTLAADSSLKLKKAEGITTLKNPETKSDDSKPAHVYGQIRLEGMQYLTPVPDAPRLTYSQLLSARLSILKEASWIDAASDVSAGTFFSRGQTHLIVHEAYVASKGETFKVFAGRKKKDWSDIDHRWNLGLWQPYLTIDALRPEEEGLTGVFFDYNKKDWEVMLMVTPMFIPSMGPDVREEGGGLVADSRWYRAPSRNYDFNSRINTISYKLDIPEQAKLVNNGGASLMTRLGDKSKGTWMVVSAGYLPVNDLILKRQAFKQTSEDKVDVTVRPAVTYHQIQSVDVGYTFKSIKTTLSYLQDSPEKTLPEEEWVIQNLQPLQAYSAALDFALQDILTKTIAVQIAYLKVVGGGIQDVTSTGSPDDFTLYDSRLKFTNSLMLRLEGQVATLYKRPLVTRIKYLYDYDQRGSLLNTEFQYYPSQKWAVVMGGDVLGVQDEDYKASSFLNQFRANDRFYGGMTYVF